MTNVRVPRIQWASVTGGSHLLREDAFRRFWIARLLTHTASNAALYAFLVLVVEKTGSTFQSSLLVVSYILPTATLGAVSGAVVDHLPKGMTLFAANLVRAALLVLLLVLGDGVWAIYAVALLLAVANQFITPAEQAALPIIVGKRDLVSANSVNNLGALASQLLGLAVLAPAFLATVGPEPLYVVAAVLLTAGAVNFAGVPSLGGLKAVEDAAEGIQDVRVKFARAWRTLTRDIAAYMAVIMLVLANSTALVCVALAPKYVVNVLDVEARYSIFIFAPSAIGIIAALRFVDTLVKRVSGGWLIAGAFVTLVAGLMGLGLVAQAGQLIPIGDTGGLILMTMVFATAAAFSYTVMNIAARSIVNERMPVEMQGRIFAAQFVLTNLASIPPLLLTGVLAQWLGVTPVLILVAVAITLIAGWFAADSAARRPIEV